MEIFALLIACIFLELSIILRQWMVKTMHNNGSIIIPAKRNAKPPKSQYKLNIIFRTRECVVLWYPNKSPHPVLIMFPVQNAIIEIIRIIVTAVVLPIRHNLILNLQSNGYSITDNRS